MVFRGSLLRRSLTGGDRPKLKKIHPLIVMARQRFFQKAHGLSQSFLQGGISVVVAGWNLRWDLRWHRRDRIPHQSAVAQPTLANHKAGQNRGARPLRKQKR